MFFALVYFDNIMISYEAYFYFWGFKHSYVGIFYNFACLLHAIMFFLPRYAFYLFISMFKLIMFKVPFAYLIILLAFDVYDMTDYYIKSAFFAVSGWTKLFIRTSHLGCH
jgi:hypothetical protein